MIDTIENIKKRFDSLQSENGDNGFGGLRQRAFEHFSRLGIPSARHEEWKYTRISSLFNRTYQMRTDSADILSASELATLRLPGSDNANEIFFINGQYSSSHSVIRSSSLLIQPLEESSRNEYSDMVLNNLGHSGNYLKDGINALNTAFLKGGIFLYVKKGQVVEHPLYIYNIIDGRTENIFAQPRSLFYIGENAQVQIVETYSTIGQGEGFTNQVMEMVVEKNAMVEYYKIQNDSSQSNQVSTTHVRQIGKSYVHTVVISLNGGIVRNNLNIVMEAEQCESHLYGLYFISGQSHVDNHTVVDNVKPNCLSNELYKGIINDHATAVFNGKIFVQPHAQKTNAYQSNKNILLSDSASVNTKPQLEIFADDVKCSHGCTVGQLDEEAMFYLRSRGVGEKMARSLLVHAFAIDILEHIKPEPIRKYIDKLISERLEFDLV